MAADDSGKGAGAGLIGPTQELPADSSAPRAGVAAKLVVVAGPDEGLERAVSGVLEIGTDPSSSLVLHDPAVSRHHLAVTQVGDRFLVRDRGSRNGTFLGGARMVEAEVPLGGVLTLGSSALALHPRWYVREVSPSSARSFGEVLGEAVAMREVFAILERVAPTDLTVLVEGESGTGKELVARSIHKASARHVGPYVVFDCASVARELAESEIFGHRRGAFTGAVQDRPGAFQQAQGGTLCLDEVGELPLELQPKLLRVLEAGEVKSVGDDAPRKVDVRVLAATNRDLHAEARRGRFRADLLYRLEVVRVRLPSLRQRPEDVPLLVKHFLADRLPAGDVVAGENLDKLLAYGWPGNVRELRNTLARAVALASTPGQPPAPFARLVLNLGPGFPEPATLGSSMPGVATAMPYKVAREQLLMRFERAYVEALLERNGGNLTRAAKAAGLSRKHLRDLARRALDGHKLGDD